MKERLQNAIRQYLISHKQLLSLSSLRLPSVPLFFFFVFVSAERDGAGAGRPRAEVRKGPER